MVYKLVARTDDDGQMIGVVKKSKDKQSIGGRKYALRRLDANGVARAELIGIDELPEDDGEGVADRELLVQLVRGGEIVGREHCTVEAARRRHEASMAELPRSAHQLSQGQAAVETVFVTETP